MTRNEALSGRGIAVAAILSVAALFVAYLCFRTAIVEALPPSTPVVARLAPHDPDVVLDKAATALVKQHGILDTATLAAVRRAAKAAPLDARAFLILAHQQLLEGQPERALATLEAGQRFDPRNQVIHLLLADRYLRTGRTTQAAGQFAVMARLGAEGPIAPAMAQMSTAPDTRDAVRRVLQSDPRLERDVLTHLAAANTPPATIFAIAGPAARRGAGDKESWGPVLVSRLVAHGQFAEARRVWQAIYHLTDAQAAAPLFDPDFRMQAATPPFNWTFAAGSLGAADPRNGNLAIDYYGRDSGDLASQLLVLKPGGYRFAFTVDGGKTDTGPTLAWVVRCAPGGKPELMRVAVTGTAARRRVAIAFAVPANCPAQTLALIGEAGDFPATIDVSLRDLALQPLETRR